MLSFERVKALAQAALITQVWAGCVSFWEENLLAKQSPEKVTRGHVYNQNGYDTRSHDRCSTLVDKQINQMMPLCGYTLRVSYTKSDDKPFW